MLRLGLATLFVVMLQGSVWAAGEIADPWEESESPAAASSSEPAAAAPRPSSKVSSKKPKVHARRSRSATGAPVVGHVVPDELLRSEPALPPSGNLHLEALANHESLKVNVYNPDGSYNIEALDAVSRLLRCKRTGVQKSMEPRLLTILSHVYDHFGERKIEIVSGYRNQRRTSSYHFKASATDIRVDGVAPKKLRAFLESLDAGGMGIGLYPRTNFVHVDVRSPPSYRWIDWSRSDPDSADKRPPRKTGKRKKLQS